MADKGSSTDFFVPDFTEESKGGKKRVKNWPRSTRIIWTIAASLALVMVIIVFNMDDDRRSRRTPISAIPEVRDVNPATGLFSNADAVREMVYRNLREQIAAELSESMQGTPAAAEPERPQASTRVVRRPPSAEYQSARQRGTAAFVAPSGISLGIGGGDGPDASAAPGGDTLNQLLSAMGTGDAGVLGALGAGGGGGVAGIMPRDIVGSDPNAANVAHQDRMNAFLRTNAGAGAASSVQSEYLSSGPRPPLSPYELKTGSIISGVMVGGINSDLPGTILGQVTENVFDTATGRHLLIPQGSRMVGAYDSHIVYGQNRLLVVWNRIIFPDGTSLNLEGMTGSDTRGYAGFKQRIDRHYSRMIGAAIFASVFVAAGKEATKDERGSSGGMYGRDERSTEAVFADTLMQNVTDVATRLIERNMNVAPTLRILPGYRFIIITTKDVNFAEPYVVADNRRGRR